MNNPIEYKASFPQTPKYIFFEKVLVQMGMQRLTMKW